MPAQNPKKISITAPPAAPKPKQADPTIPSTKARMTDPREAENRRNLEAVQRGVDYLQEPAGRQRSVPAVTTTARGGASGAGGGSGGGGTVKQTLWQGLLGGGAQPKAQAAMQMAPAASPASQPYRESDGPRRFSAAPAATQPSVQQYMANQLLNRVSTTGYSPGVLATRERQKAQQELAGLGLPPAAHSAALARIQQGDTQVVNRAAQLVSQVPPEALGRGKVAQYIAQELLGGDGAAKFDAGRQADLGRYRQVAQKNTERAQANSGQAIKFGMDPLASEQQLVAEQRRRNQMAYPSADLASLQKLAAAGDVDAARAIEGQPGPWAPGRPELGVRRNTQDSARQVLDEAQARAMELGQQRYVVPKEIQADADQKVAQYAMQGRVDAATINAASRTPGSSQAAAAMRAWGVQMGERQKLFQPTVPFPQWARENGINIPAPTQPAASGAAPTGGQGPVPAAAPATATADLSDPVVAKIATDPEYYTWYMSNPNGDEQRQFYENIRSGRQ